MTTIEILEDNIKLKQTRFNTFEELITEIEDYKLGKIMQENNAKDSFDISLLEKKYLG